MIFLFEAHVNGYMVPKTNPEFSMLETFLRSMQGRRAFRTEWVIFGEELRCFLKLRNLQLGVKVDQVELYRPEMSL